MGFAIFGPLAKGFLAGACTKGDFHGACRLLHCDAPLRERDMRKNDDLIGFLYGTAKCIEKLLADPA